MSRCRVIVLLALVVAASPPRGIASDAKSDEDRLTKELGGADAERLLTYLRGQLGGPESTKRFAELIEQLGNTNFRTRQEATKKLVEAGPVALPQLKAASTHSDKEVSGRAKRCVNDIQQSPRYDLPVVAIRHLGRVKEKRGVELMLSFLPTSADEPFHADVMEALAGVGVSGQEVHPALTKALDEPKLRAAAVQLLLRRDDPAVRKQMKVYLTDKDPAVRFHVAMNLLKRGDRDAVAALIGVIAEAPTVAFWQQAEETLYALAGDLAPSVEVKGASAADRIDMAQHWSDWWKAKGDQVLLGRKDDHPNDTCIMCETGQVNRVSEWKPEGKPRFDITDLVGPVDARILPGKRVLIAEQNNRKVSERDFNGKIVWEHTFDDGPVSVMRLPNGNTFVATMTRVTEVRRDGEEVYSYLCDPMTTISDANRLSDGRIAIITTDDQVIWLGANGKELKRIDVDSQGALEAQPNGGVLVSQVGTGRITEFDAKYDKVVDLQLDGAWMATKLPDGHYLVASKTRQRMTKVDTKGKVVYEHTVEGNPHAIHWR